jgi:hypothetical protein
MQATPSLGVPGRALRRDPGRTARHAAVSWPAPRRRRWWSLAHQLERRRIESLRRLARRTSRWSLALRRRCATRLRWTRWRRPTRSPRSTTLCWTSTTTAESSDCGSPAQRNRSSRLAYCRQLNAETRKTSGVPDRASRAPLRFAQCASRVVSSRSPTPAVLAYANCVRRPVAWCFWTSSAAAACGRASRDGRIGRRARAVSRKGFLAGRPASRKACSTGCRLSWLCRASAARCSMRIKGSTARERVSWPLAS